MQKLHGERVNGLEVATVIDNIFGDTQHKKRQLSLANATLGVVNSASLIVHRIGLGLAKSTGLSGKHSIKQVDRLLSNTKLSVGACFSCLVPYIVGERQAIVTTLDWTDFDHDNQATLSVNLVTTHGHSTPLVWKTVKK